MESASGKILIFLHIPKAAGTTLHSIIADNYKTGEMFTVQHKAPYRLEDLQRMPAAERARFRVVKGHLTFGVHELLPQPSTYVTLLRDPVDRVISHYYYVLRRPTHPLYQQVTAEKMNLREYVEQFPQLCNGQVRFLAGEDLTPDKPCTREMLGRAKSNLERHFSVVGLAERFDESVIVCRRVLGWKTPFYWNQNVTRDRPKRESMAEEVMEALRRANALDVELYQFAAARFTKAMDAQPGFQSEVNEFQRKNVIFGEEKESREAFAKYRRRGLPWVFWPGAWQARWRRNAVRRKAESLNAST